MPPWRLALLPLLPASVVFLILASVVFLILASVVLLTVALEVHSLALAPVVLFLISVAPLVHRALVAGFSVIFRAALRATATAGLQAIATAVTGGGNRSYGVYVDGNYGSSDSYADEGCYYTYTSRRHRGVVVCSKD